jgi:hypothetical protein
MTEKYFLQKRDISIDFYNGYINARFLINSLAKGGHSDEWLDKTFGFEPSAEKRAAQLALTKALSLLEIPREAVIAAYEQAKESGNLVILDMNKPATEEKPND